MAAAKAQGAVQGDYVLVADVAQANRLHNKSFVGTPQPGNVLRLSFVEAAWCVATNSLNVAAGKKTLGVADLLVLGPVGGQRTEVEYLVYRDLRERGLVARHAGGRSHLNVWPRGKSDGEPEFMTVAVAEGDPVKESDLLDGAQGGIVVCVVDEEGAVTHYAVALDDPKGEVPEGKLPEATGRVLADRVLVEDSQASAAYRKEFIGRKHENGTILSTLEAEALRRRGVLDVEAVHAETALLPIYLDLRRRGVVTKSGFRFGTHLRGYRSDPDDEHAEWLIHASSGHLTLSDLSRGVRLAHGVRKKFLIAISTPEGVRYVHVRWVRP